MQIALANSLRPSCFFSSTPSENIRSTDPPIIICSKYCDVVCRHKIDHDPEEYKKCASACMLRCKGWFARKRRNTWSRMSAKRCMKGITDVVPRKYMECAFRYMLDFRRMVERKWRWPWQLISRLACMIEFSLALPLFCMTRINLELCFSVCYYCPSALLYLLWTVLSGNYFCHSI